MEFVEPVTLRDSRVTLVPLTFEHAEGLAAAARDGELWSLVVTSVPEPGAEQAYIQTALEMPGRVPFAVLDADGTVLGSTSYHDILPRERRVEIGYTWYARRAQRTHVNTVCKLLMLRHAFDTLGCATVGWRTDPDNHVSQRAILRLGARLDGTVRGVRMRRDGTISDATLFSLTVAEWPAVRDRLERLVRTAT